MKTTKRKKFLCGYCRKGFTTLEATRMHAMAAHSGQTVYLYESRERVCGQPHEQSLADIAVEAEIKRAMGEPLDELEESLLND